MGLGFRAVQGFRVYGFRVKGPLPAELDPAEDVPLS